ncbi:MAG: glycosyltransferase [Halioglobus sp.]|nr:glycosyltransferase [Halioglobus sp.]
MTDPAPKRVAFLLDNLRGGGAERVVLSLAAGFKARDYAVDLLVCELRGELAAQLPAGVNVVELTPAPVFATLRSVVPGAGVTRELLGFVSSARKLPGNLRFVRAVADYLDTVRPDVLYSALPKANVVGVLARRLAPDVSTRVFVGVQNPLSVRAARGRSDGRGQLHHMLPLLSACYAAADGVIAASQGVADDAVELLGLAAHHVTVVHNPVDVAAASTGRVPDHPWFAAPGPPVVLAIGRMVPQKNFHLLLHAIALVNEEEPVRLMILGGDDSDAAQVACRTSLEELAAALGIGDVLSMPGFASNTQDYLRAANLFALSSIYEGFGLVLVEALLAGCPVVSTDCPSGPAEILEGGRHGRLVPVNDAAALAAAIRQTLAEEPDRDALRERGEDFAPERAVAAYAALFG